MKRKALIALAAVLLTSLSIPCAHAAGGFYLGAGLGHTRITDDTGSGQFDSGALAFKAFAGYRFNIIPIIDLAAEVGYTDFGKPSQTVNGQAVVFKLHGVNAAGLVIFPLGPIDLYGKVGMLSWSLDSNPSGNTTSTSGTDPFYGVGVGFKIRSVGFRGEFEQYQIKDVDRVQMFSLSLVYQF